MTERRPPAPGAKRRQLPLPPDARGGGEARSGAVLRTANDSGMGVTTRGMTSGRLGVRWLGVLLSAVASGVRGAGEGRAVDAIRGGAPASAHDARGTVVVLDGSGGRGAEAAAAVTQAVLAEAVGDSAGLRSLLTVGAGRDGDGVFDGSHADADADAGFLAFLDDGDDSNAARGFATRPLDVIAPPRATRTRVARYCVLMPAGCRADQGGHGASTPAPAAGFCVYNVPAPPLPRERDTQTAADDVVAHVVAQLRGAGVASDAAARAAYVVVVPGGGARGNGVTGNGNDNVPAAALRGALTDAFPAARVWEVVGDGGDPHASPDPGTAGPHGPTPAAVYRGVCERARRAWTAGAAAAADENILFAAADHAAPHRASLWDPDYLAATLHGGGHAAAAAAPTAATTFFSSLPATIAAAAVTAGSTIHDSVAYVSHIAKLTASWRVCGAGVGLFLGTALLAGVLSGSTAGARPARDGRGRRRKGSGRRAPARRRESAEGDASLPLLPRAMGGVDPGRDLFHEDPRLPATIEGVGAALPQLDRETFSRVKQTTYELRRALEQRGQAGGGGDAPAAGTTAGAVAAPFFPAGWRPPDISDLVPEDAAAVAVTDVPAATAPPGAWRGRGYAARGTQGLATPPASGGGRGGGAALDGLPLLLPDADHDESSTGDASEGVCGDGNAAAAGDDDAAEARRLARAVPEELEAPPVRGGRGRGRRNSRGHRRHRGGGGGVALPAWLAAWWRPEAGGGPHGGTWRECCVTLDVPGEGPVCQHLTRGPPGSGGRRAGDAAGAAPLSPIARFVATPREVVASAVRALSPRRQEVGEKAPVTPPRAHDTATSPGFTTHGVPHAPASPARRPLRLREVELLAEQSLDGILGGGGGGSGVADAAAAAAKGPGGSGVLRPVSVPYPLPGGDAVAAVKDTPRGAPGSSTRTPGHAAAAAGDGHTPRPRGSRPLSIPHWSCCGKTDYGDRTCPYTRARPKRSALWSGVQGVGYVLRLLAVVPLDILRCLVVVKPKAVTQAQAWCVWGYRRAAWLVASPWEALRQLLLLPGKVPGAWQRFLRWARGVRSADVMRWVVNAAAWAIKAPPRACVSVFHGTRYYFAVLAGRLAKRWRMASRNVSRNKLYIKACAAARQLADACEGQRAWLAGYAGVVWDFAGERVMRVVYWIAGVLEAFDDTLGIYSALCWITAKCRQLFQPRRAYEWCLGWLTFFLSPPDPTTEYRPPIDLAALPRKTALAKHLKASGVSQLEALRRLDKASVTSGSDDESTQSSMGFAAWAREGSVEDRHEMYMRQRAMSEGVPFSLERPKRVEDFLPTSSSTLPLLGETLTSVDLAGGDGTATTGGLAMQLASPRKTMVSHATQTGRRLMRELKREAIHDLVPMDAHPRDASPAPATPPGRELDDDYLFDVLVKRPWNQRHMVSPKALKRRASALPVEPKGTGSSGKSVAAAGAPPPPPQPQQKVKFPGRNSRRASPARLSGPMNAADAAAGSVLPHLDDPTPKVDPINDVELVDPRSPGRRANHYAPFHSGMSSVKSPAHQLHGLGGAQGAASGPPDPVRTLIGGSPPIPLDVHKAQMRMKSAERFNSFLKVEPYVASASPKLKRSREDEFFHTEPVGRYAPRAAAPAGPSAADGCSNVFGATFDLDRLPGQQPKPFERQLTANTDSDTESAVVMFRRE